MPRVGVNRLNLKFKHLKSDQKQVTRIVRDWGPDTPDSPDYPYENPDSPGQEQRSQKLDKCE